ncbi:MAG: VacJ family lipoprotein [Sulfurospirillaceae bacterium]|nr:VacJ family lipoprotein [Sulfurospirillaceae bacterium]
MRILFLTFITVFTLFGTEYINPTPYVSTSATSGDDFEKEFTAKEETNLFDPLSGYNEVMTTINDKFYVYLLRPTAVGYSYVVPELARTGISNFFENLFFPIRFINNLLQFKFQNSFEELERFALNSTIGILGFMDVAKDEFGIQAHSEDLGQTLGYYGVGNGFHVVLPLLGPSNVRDMAGIFGDSWVNPINYIESRHANLVDNNDESLYITLFHTINKTSLHVEEFDNLRKDAIELYPFLRNLYESRRTKLISE